MAKTTTTVLNVTFKVNLFLMKSSILTINVIIIAVDFQNLKSHFDDLSPPIKTIKITYPTAIYMLNKNNPHAKYEIPNSYSP